MYIVAEGVGREHCFGNFIKSCAIDIHVFSCTQKGCLRLRSYSRTFELVSTLQCCGWVPWVPRPEAHWLSLWWDSRLRLELASFFCWIGRWQKLRIFITSELPIWHTPEVQILEGLYPKLWGLSYSWFKCLTKAWNVNFYCWNYNLRYLCSSLWEGLLLIQGIRKWWYALSCQYNQLILSMLFFFP